MATTARKPVHKATETTNMTQSLQLSEVHVLGMLMYTLKYS